MNKKLALAALLASAATFSAQANEDLSYSFVQASYDWSSYDVGGVGLDLNGWDIKGSLEFGDHFYGYTSYQDSDGDDFDFDYSYSKWTLGFGYHMPINESVDWFAQAGYVQEDAKFVDPYFYGTLLDESESGWNIGTGVRAMVSDSFELAGLLNYTDVNAFGAGFGMGASGIWHINQTWGLELGYGYSWRDEDMEDIRFGVRASF